MSADLGWIDAAGAQYDAQMDRDASCHFGDHEFRGGATCDYCGYFNAALLSWLRAEKAEREGRHHGDHFHLTTAKADACPRKDHPEGPCGDQGGCLHHEPSAAFDHALLVEQGLVPA